ncbi:MAG TPA: alpha-ketoacid dehydrogenase subunit beta [Polyangia bacterium]
MPVMNMVQAVNDALRLALGADDRVVVMGEDVGTFGGVFRATQGLQREFGAERVVDTPLAESGIIGTAIGMALYGLRPVAEIQFADFIYPAFCQIVNELAKFRYRSGGQYPAPVVIRAPYGGGIRGGHYHSQSPEAYFAHTAGLKVVIPASPADAKGLLLSAVRGEDPVVFLEPKRLYRAPKGEVPEGDFTVPLGVARVVRPGRAVTVLAYGAMVPVVLEAAEQAAARGVDAEVIDLRTLLPLDAETVLASVRRTGRAVIVHEAPRTCGYGAELAALLAEKALLSLEAPVLRVTGWDTPFPYTLEQDYLPSAGRVLAAIESTARFAA